MCRFVLYAGPSRSLRPLVYGGQHSLYRQSWAPRELLQGSVNADGYGVVWYQDGAPVRIARSGPIWHDQDLARLLEASRSTCAAASLRNATEGLPITDTAVQPMLLERWSFGLNGFLQGFRRTAMRRLHERLPDELYAELTGVSDTETLFLLTVGHLREGATPGEALAAVVREALTLARQSGFEAYLNLFLLDGDGFAATRAGSRERTNSLYVCEEGPLVEGGVIVASEPLDAAGAWRALSPGTLVEASAAGGVRITPLG